MTTWGPYESSGSSRLRVGIDIERSPSTLSHSTTSIDLTVKFYADSDSGDYNDTQTMTFGGSFGGSTTFENNGGTKLVATKTLSNVPINYSGSGSRSFSARISGAYNGVTPSHGVTYGLPARPAAAPDRVATPSVDEVTTTTADATWSAPDNNGDAIDQYRVVFETPGGTNVSDSYSGDRSQRTTVLDPGSDYTVKVAAHNSEGWGEFSNKRPFTTDIDTPGAIFGPSYSNITSSSVRVNYSFPTNGGGIIDEVEILYDSDQTAAATVSDTNGSPRDISDLRRATRYDVRFRAHNQAGWGNYNLVTSFTTLSAAPAAPVLGPPTVVDHQTVRLSWSPPTDNGGESVLHYDIQAATNSTFSTGLVTFSNQSGLTVDMGSLTPSTLYYFRVRGENSVGNGAWSATKSATTDLPPITDPSLAPQVSGLTASAFSLKGVAGASTREFQIATNTGFTVGVVTKSVTTVSALFQDVKPGTTYYGRYRIDNGTGFGAYSPYVTVNPPRRPVRWDGTHWVDDISYWNGSEYVAPSGPQKRWSGSAWL